MDGAPYGGRNPVAYGDVGLVPQIFEGDGLVSRRPAGVCDRSGGSSFYVKNERTIGIGQASSLEVNRGSNLHADLGVKRHADFTNGPPHPRHDGNRHRNSAGPRVCGSPVGRRIALTQFTVPIYPIETIRLPASRSCTTCGLTAERSLTLHPVGDRHPTVVLNTLREQA